MWKIVGVAALGLLAGFLTWLALREEPGGRAAGRSRGEAMEPTPDLRPGDAPSAPKRPPSEDVEKSRLSGRVLDSDRRPIRGARVNEACTDGEGRYELPLEPQGCDVVAEGFLPLVGVRWSEEFRLQRAAVLSGRVLDERGAPVAGALVYAIRAEHAALERADPSNSALSDEEGVYLFPGLAAGLTDIGVKAEEYLPRLVRDIAIPEAGQATLDLVLSRGRSVLVTVNVPCVVIASDSRLRGQLLPPGGTRFLASALPGRSFAALPAVARAVRERESLGGLPGGPCDFEAVMPGYVADPGLGRFEGVGGSEITLALVKGARFPVRARDSVTGQEIRPTVARKTEGIEELLPVEDGLVPADARKHSLHFHLAGYRPLALELPPLQADRTETTEVWMEPVEKGETGSFLIVFDPPVAGRVAVIGRDAQRAWERHIAASDDEGRWLVGDVPIGTFTITVLATEKVPVVLAGIVVDAASRPVLNVRATSGGGLSLRIVDAAGTPVEGVRLELLDAAGHPIDLQILNMVGSDRGFISINYVPAAGEVRAESGIAPGAYTVTAMKDGFQPATESFQIRDLETASVTLTLRKRS
jgi:protocatechuate 3,4-dioxygenase beta subunit